MMRTGIKDPVTWPAESVSEHKAAEVMSEDEMLKRRIEESKHERQ